MNSKPRKGHRRPYGLPYSLENDAISTSGPMQTPCLVWRWARTKDGYGQRCGGGTVRYAHRWSYEEHIGKIPDGMQIDHLCRNRACVEPSHLEVVLPAVNCHRGAQPVLTARAVFIIREYAAWKKARNNRMPRTLVAKAFNCAIPTIASALSGRNWVGASYECEVGDASDKQPE